MKKNLPIILAAALLLCTACQSKSVGNDSENDVSSSSTAPVSAGSADPVDTSEPDSAGTGELPQPSETEEITTEQQTNAFFKPGVWQCSEYYFYEFDANGTSGRTMDFDSSVGMPFEYEVTDADSGALMFHIFSADDKSPATAKILSDSEIELTWDFGRTDPLTYLTGKTLDDVEAEIGHFFKPGTWRGADGYYFFNDDGTSGSTQSFEMGIGVGFNYEVMSRSNGFVNIHKGAADVSEGVVISDKTEDSFTITWENGTQEKLVYVSPRTTDEFKFYTNEDLQQIALKYYQANNDGYTPQYAGVKSNDDGTATIQLYDQVTDHNTTVAWYTIDRVTLKATDDIMGSEIDMSGYAD